MLSRLRLLGALAAVAAAVGAAPAVAHAGTYDVSVSTAADISGWQFFHDPGFYGCSFRSHPRAVRRQRRRVADPASDLRPRHRRPPGECLLGVGRAANHHDRERLGAGRHRDRRHRHLRIHEGSPSQRIVRRHAAAPHGRERRHVRLVDPLRERGDRALPEDRRRPHLRRQVEEHDPDHRPHRPASRRHSPERVAVGPAGVGRLAQPVPAGEPHSRRGRRRSGRCDRVAPTTARPSSTPTRSPPSPGSSRA